MSCFSLNIPSIREIENSLQHSRKLIQESMNLSRKNLVCNKCHLCSKGSCSKLPYTDYKERQGSFKKFLADSPTTVNFDYHEHKDFLKSYQSEKGVLSFQNNKIPSRKQSADYSLEKLLKKSMYSETSEKKSVKDRIDLLEQNIEDLESVYKKSVNDMQSTAFTDNYRRLQGEIEKTEDKYAELDQKINFLRNSLKNTKKRNYDSHCKKCIH